MGMDTRVRNKRIRDSAAYRAEIYYEKSESGVLQS